MTTPEPGRIGAERVAELAELLHPEVLHGQTMINLTGNVQVAPEPAGNFRRPSPPEESPVDEALPRLSTTVTLSLTVPQDAVGSTVTRLSAALSAAVQEAGEDGWLGAASLSLYPVTDEDGESEE